MSTIKDELGATVAGAHTLSDRVGLSGTMQAAVKARPPTENRGGTLRGTVLPPPPTVATTPSTRYAPVRKLGVGGMGEVALEHDHDIDRIVAIKRPIEALDGEGLTRFAREVRTIGRLEHPGIVPIHDVGVDDDGRHFFVMKYVEGETLANIIAKLAAGDPTYLARYTYAYRTQVFMQLLQAVRYAHAKGVLHRDIKPENIMVGPYGEVMLMDWGIARELDGAPEPARDEAAPPRSVTETAHGSILGTPAYMSPEQARGEIGALDVRSDVYSLGVVFYELIMLEHYLPAKSSTLELIASIGHEPDVSAREVFAVQTKAQAPAELTHFLRRSMRKAPAERFQSVDEMLGALDAIRDDHIQIQCHLTFMKRVIGALNRAIDRHPGLATGALALTLLLSVWGVYAAAALLVHR